MTVRNLDAICVGTVLSSKSKDLVTTDARMRAVAKIMGLRTIP